MAKIEVGKVLTDKSGNKFELVIELPKENWATEFKSYQSVSKVFGVFVNEYLQKSQLPLHTATKSFKSFIKEFKKLLKVSDFFDVLDFTTKSGTFDEMMFYGFESKDGQVKRRIHTTDSIVETSFLFHDNVSKNNLYQSSKVDVALAPFDDGVLLLDINVQNKGVGIGHDIIDELISISEDLDIPLYLIPYPSENYKPTDEKKLVKKLESFYSKFYIRESKWSKRGYSPKLWSNYHS